ncbi:MAG: hypothetical protein JO266_12930 [Acidobacteria bacterium]|nr:hypothetical protein [Acidobacteriota bacterium]
MDCLGTFPVCPHAARLDVMIGGSGVRLGKRSAIVRVDYDRVFERLAIASKRKRHPIGRRLVSSVRLLRCLLLRHLRPTIDANPNAMLPGNRNHPAG